MKKTAYICTIYLSFPLWYGFSISAMVSFRARVKGRDFFYIEGVEVVDQTRYDELFNGVK